MSECNKLGEEIYRYLVENSTNLQNSNLQKFTVSFLSFKFAKSRIDIQKEINNLFEQKRLFKINQQPILYLPTVLNPSTKQYVYADYNTFMDIYTNKHNDNCSKKESPFAKVIGANGSLKGIISQCESAVNYPKGGLPLLLLGPTGSGKSFLANCMYEYGCYKEIFNEHSRFVAINCSEYANNPELFLVNLFGCKKGAYTGADKDTKGLIALANGGMLFLDEIHCLSKDCQEKLFQFMDKGTYHMVGDNEKWYSANEHLVFATTEDPTKVLLKTLFRRIPIVLNVPCLQERTKREKQLLIQHLFELESQRIQKKIRVSNHLNSLLLKIEFSENIGQLLNTVRVTVANEYLKQASFECLTLDVIDLPDWILSNVPFNELDSTQENKQYYDIDQLDSLMHDDVYVYSFGKDLIVTYDNPLLSQNTKFIRYEKRFNQYYDSLIFGVKSSNAIEYTAYTSLIEGILKKLQGKYNIDVTNVLVSNTALIMGDLYLNSWIDEEFNSYDNVWEALISEFTMQNSNLVAMAYDFFYAFQNLANYKFSSFMFVLIILMFKTTIKIKQDKSTNIVVLCHGYSTASSLATSVNSMLQDNCIDAMDMPIDVSFAAISQKLNDYILQRIHLKQLIIAVDMGSLEQIGKELNNSNINCLVINNVTLSLLLELAIKVKQNMPLAEIHRYIETMINPIKSSYYINVKKEKIIVTCCATGMATAEKISRLIEQSLPKQVHIKVIEYSYNVLASNGKNGTLFDQYDVLFIVGTINPNISNIPFISVEQMLNIDDNSVVFSRLNLEDDQEKDYFKKSILKNFSLENLLDNLTILNPKKIVNYVETIINDIELGLNIKFNGSTSVGLYLHISCLIERLITDKYITIYDNLDAFINEHQSFIALVKDAFSMLEKTYCVELPMSEIAYIYDYISQFNCDYNEESDDIFF